MDFLPEDLELGAAKEEIETLFICQAEEDGPPFELYIKVLPIKEYRKIFRKLQAMETGGFRQQQAVQDKVDREYLDAVVKGGRGLTIANWETIVQDGRGLTGENIEEWRKLKKEIPVTSEVIFYIYRNSWPENFGNKIFKIVKDGADAADREEEELKNE